MAKKFTAAGIAKKLNSAKFKLEVETLDNYEKLDIEKGTIDTGSASMNSIISGSPIGGVPIGKTTGFYGRSGCGKSYIIGKTVASAQKMGFIPLIVDTENAWNANAEGYGLDISECIRINGRVIENVRNTIVKAVKALDEEITAGLKLIVVIDSLAGLRSAKEVKDVEDSKDAADMGQRAKAMKTLFSTLNDELGERNITFLWTNHMIADPGQQFKSSVEKMPGGFTIVFLSDIIIGMKRVEIGDEDSGKDSTVRNSGARIPIECIKQRFICPFRKASMLIDYKTGLDRYYGLFDIAMEFGVITGNRTYALKDGTKLGYRKAIEADPYLWKNIIIPALDPVIREEYGFGSKKTKQLLTEIELDEAE